MPFVDGVAVVVGTIVVDEAIASETVGGGVCVVATEFLALVVVSVVASDVLEERMVLSLALGEGLCESASRVVEAEAEPKRVGTSESVLSWRIARCSFLNTTLARVDPNR